ncbi:Flp family type IVb pilin [Vibrio cincinnatiensis]|uniref:Flp family type IVb pilin n=1 Tax=Vibrio cincinnatiensis TaxID=675 RepID=UPI0012ACA43A|nr:Flp family type IVb pilin [Vibrio cincinnatiensis]
MFIIKQLIIKTWCKGYAFLYDNKGASGIEYAIIATIAAIAIALFTSGDDSIADGIKKVLTDIKGVLPS